ncbi:MAG: pyridoxal phosphate-dependent aminotransferase [Lachnospiraceae bacterium]|nr:pyridoxal phosphate-dependent aminotransferase [Lachnospiraceae bacterium]
MSLTLSKKASEVKPSSTLAITAKAKALREQGVDIVGFGAGEPDFNTPDNINQCAVNAIEEGFTKYTPASGIEPLKKAISDKFRKFNHLEYGADQIVISNGGKHSLTNIFTAIINEGDEVVIPAPFWLSYPEIVKLAGGVPVIVTTTKEENFKITPEKLAAACNEKTKAFILNSPNNPTGMIYTKEELEALAKVVVEKDIYVVADEMYEYLIYGEDEHISIGSLGQDIYEHTITCSGLSKSYAMTGWRIGYTGASKEITKLMSSVQSHQTSNPNSIAQKAALEALTGPQDKVKEMIEEFASRRDYIYSRIQALPHVSAPEPKGAFYAFIDMGETLGLTYKGEKVGDISTLADILLEDYQVAVVPCTDFGFPEYIRLSYAISKEQIEKGMNRLEKFLNDLK